MNLTRRLLGLRPYQTDISLITDEHINDIDVNDWAFHLLRSTTLQLCGGNQFLCDMMHDAGIDVDSDISKAALNFQRSQNDETDEAMTQALRTRVKWW